MLCHSVEEERARRGPPVMEPEQVLKAHWHQGGVHWQEFLMNFNYWPIKANELNEQPEHICGTAGDESSAACRDFVVRLSPWSVTAEWEQEVGSSTHQHMLGVLTHV